MRHYVKTRPEYFGDKNKSFTIRKDDRNPSYQVGDTLVSREWDGEKYTGREESFEIVYKLDGGQYGLLEGYCGLGLKRLPRTNREWLNSLSDEELAKFLDHFPVCEAFYGQWCPNAPDCRPCYLKWLQAEREDDHD